MRKRSLSKVLAVSLATVMMTTSVPIGQVEAEASTIQAQASKKVNVNSISLNYSTYTLKEGKKLKLEATILPKKSSNSVKIVWESSNPSVAKVNKNGKVTALKNGKTTIKARVEGTTIKATTKIIVGVPVKNIILGTSSARTLVVGEDSWCSAEVTPSDASNKKLEYSSSDTSVATVGAKGKIKAKSPGTATITIKSTDGSNKVKTITVTVVAKEGIKPVEPTTEAPTEATTEAPATEVTTEAPTEATTEAPGGGSVIIPPVITESATQKAENALISILDDYYTSEPKLKDNVTLEDIEKAEKLIEDVSGTSKDTLLAKLNIAKNLYSAKVNAEISAVISNIKLNLASGEVENAIKSDFTVPVDTINGVNISWEVTEGQDIVSLNNDIATINRPLYELKDEKAKLVATFTKDGEVQTKEFNIIVLKQEPTSLQQTIELLNSATKDNIVSIIESSSELNIDLSDYNDLSDEYKNLVASQLVSSIPEDGYSIKLADIDNSANLIKSSFESFVTSAKLGYSLETITAKVNNLFNEDKTELNDIVELTDIDSAEALVNSLEDSEEKTALLEDISKARGLYVALCDKKLESSIEELKQYIQNGFSGYSISEDGNSLYINVDSDFTLPKKLSGSKITYISSIGNTNLNGSNGEFTVIRPAYEEVPETEKGIVQTISISVSRDGATQDKVLTLYVTVLKDEKKESTVNLENVKNVINALVLGTNNRLSAGEYDLPINISGCSIEWSVLDSDDLKYVSIDNVSGKVIVISPEYSNGEESVDLIANIKSENAESSSTVQKNVHLICKEANALQKAVEAVSNASITSDIEMILANSDYISSLELDLSVYNKLENKNAVINGILNWGGRDSLGIVIGSSLENSKIAIVSKFNSLVTEQLQKENAEFVETAIKVFKNAKTVSDVAQALSNSEYLSVLGIDLTDYNKLENTYAEEVLSAFAKLDKSKMDKAEDIKQAFDKIVKEKLDKQNSDKDENNKNESNADVNEAFKNFDFEKYEKSYKLNDKIELPTSIFGVTIDWKSGNTSYVKIDDGKVTIIDEPKYEDTDINVKITGVFSKEGATDKPTGDINITVLKANATVEQTAVEAINNASMTTLADVISENAITLGIDLTDYNKLIESGRYANVLSKIKILGSQSIKLSDIENSINKIKDTFDKEVEAQLKLLQADNNNATLSQILKDIKLDETKEDKSYIYKLPVISGVGLSIVSSSAYEVSGDSVTISRDLYESGVESKSVDIILKATIDTESLENAITVNVNRQKATAEQTAIENINNATTENIANIISENATIFKFDLENYSKLTGVRKDAVDNAVLDLKDQSIKLADIEKSISKIKDVFNKEVTQQLNAQNLLDDEELVAEVKASIDLIETISDNYVTYSLESNNISGVSISIVENDAYTVSGDSLIVERDAFEKGKASKEIDIKLNLIKNGAEDSKRLTKTVPCAEATAEQKAIQAINSASMTTLANVISENAITLGIDLTDYNKLTDDRKTNVLSAVKVLESQSIKLADIEKSIKTISDTFNTAVKEQLKAQNLSEDKAIIDELKKSIDLVEEISDNYVTYSLENTTISGVSISIVTSSAYTVSGDSLIVERDAYEDGKASKNVEITLNFVKDDVEDSVKLTKTVSCVEATAEQKAIEAINNTPITSLADVISENAITLGIDLTDYNELNETRQFSVILEVEKLGTQSIKLDDIDNSVKTISDTFNTAVKEQLKAQNLSKDTEVIEELKKSIVLGEYISETKSEDKVTYSLESSSISGVSISIVTSSAYTVSGNSLIVERDVYENGKASKDVKITLSFVKDNATDSVELTKEIPCVEATAEQTAVENVNNAKTTYMMGQAITNSALGLDLTKYNTLEESGKQNVLKELIVLENQSIKLADIAQSVSNIKLAFDKAVFDEVSSQDSKNLAIAVSNATLEVSKGDTVYTYTLKPISGAKLTFVEGTGYTVTESSAKVTIDRDEYLTGKTSKNIDVNVKVEVGTKSQNIKLSVIVDSLAKTTSQEAVEGINLAESEFNMRTAVASYASILGLDLTGNYKLLDENGVNSVMNKLIALPTLPIDKDSIASSIETIKKTFDDEVNAQVNNKNTNLVDTALNKVTLIEKESTEGTYTFGFGVNNVTGTALLFVAENGYTLSGDSIIVDRPLYENGDSILKVTIKASSTTGTAVTNTTTKAITVSCQSATITQQAIEAVSNASIVNIEDILIKNATYLAIFGIVGSGTSLSDSKVADITDYNKLSEENQKKVLTAIVSLSGLSIKLAEVDNSVETVRSTFAKEVKEKLNAQLSSNALSDFNSADDTTKMAKVIEDYKEIFGLDKAYLTSYNDFAKEPKDNVLNILVANKDVINDSMGAIKTLFGDSVKAVYNLGVIVSNASVNIASASSFIENAEKQIETASTSGIEKAEINIASKAVFNYKASVSIVSKGIATIYTNTTTSAVTASGEALKKDIDDVINKKNLLIRALDRLELLNSVKTLTEGSIALINNGATVTGGVIYVTGEKQLYLPTEIGDEASKASITWDSSNVNYISVKNENGKPVTQPVINLVTYNSNGDNNDNSKYSGLKDKSDAKDIMLTAVIKADSGELVTKTFTVKVAEDKSNLSYILETKSGTLTPSSIDSSNQISDVPGKTTITEFLEGLKVSKDATVELYDLGSSDTETATTTSSGTLVATASYIWTGTDGNYAQSATGAKVNLVDNNNNKLNSDNKYEIVVKSQDGKESKEYIVTVGKRTLGVKVSTGTSLLTDNNNKDKVTVSESSLSFGSNNNYTINVNANDTLELVNYTSDNTKTSAAAVSGKFYVLDLDLSNAVSAVSESVVSGSNGLVTSVSGNVLSVMLSADKATSSVSGDGLEYEQSNKITLNLDGEEMNIDIVYEPTEKTVANQYIDKAVEKLSVEGYLTSIVSQAGIISKTATGYEISYTIGDKNIILPTSITLSAISEENIKNGENNIVSPVSITWESDESLIASNGAVTFPDSEKTVTLSAIIDSNTVSAGTVSAQTVTYSVTVKAPTATEKAIDEFINAVQGADASTGAVIEVLSGSATGISVTAQALGLDNVSSSGIKLENVLGVTHYANEFAEKLIEVVSGKPFNLAEAISASGKAIKKIQEVVAEAISGGVVTDIKNKAQAKVNELSFNDIVSGASISASAVTGGFNIKTSIAIATATENGITYHIAYKVSPSGTKTPAETRLGFPDENEEEIKNKNSSLSETGTTTTAGAVSVSAIGVVTVTRPAFGGDNLTVTLVPTVTVSFSGATVTPGSFTKAENASPISITVLAEAPTTSQQAIVDYNKIAKLENDEAKVISLSALVTATSGSILGIDTASASGITYGALTDYYKKQVAKAVTGGYAYDLATVVSSIKQINEDFTEAVSAQVIDIENGIKAYAESLTAGSIKKFTNLTTASAVTGNFTISTSAIAEVVSGATSTQTGIEYNITWSVSPESISSGTSTTGAVSVSGDVVTVTQPAFGSGELKVTLVPVVTISNSAIKDKVESVTGDGVEIIVIEQGATISQKAIMAYIDIATGTGISNEIRVASLNAVIASYGSTLGIDTVSASGITYGALTPYYKAQVVSQVVADIKAKTTNNTASKIKTEPDINDTKVFSAGTGYSYKIDDIKTSLDAIKADFAKAVTGQVADIEEGIKAYANSLTAGSIKEFTNLVSASAVTGNFTISTSAIATDSANPASKTGIEYTIEWDVVTSSSINASLLNLSLANQMDSLTSRNRMVNARNTITPATAGAVSVSAIGVVTVTRPAYTVSGDNNLTVTLKPTVTASCNGIDAYKNITATGAGAEITVLAEEATVSQEAIVAYNNIKSATNDVRVASLSAVVEKYGKALGIDTVSASGITYGALTPYYKAQVVSQVVTGIKTQTGNEYSYAKADVVTSLALIQKDFAEAVSAQVTDIKDGIQAYAESLTAGSIEKFTNLVSASAVTGNFIISTSAIAKTVSGDTATETGIAYNISWEVKAVSKSSVDTSTANLRMSLDSQMDFAVNKNRMANAKAPLILLSDDELLSKCISISGNAVTVTRPAYTVSGNNLTVKLVPTVTASFSGIDAYKGITATGTGAEITVLAEEATATQQAIIAYNNIAKVDNDRVASLTALVTTTTGSILGIDTVSASGITYGALTPYYKAKVVLQVVSDINKQNNKEYSYAKADVVTSLALIQENFTKAVSAQVTNIKNNIQEYAESLTAGSINEFTNLVSASAVTTGFAISTSAIAKDSANSDISTGIEYNIKWTVSPSAVSSDSATAGAVSVSAIGVVTVTRPAYTATNMSVKLIPTVTASFSGIDAYNKITASNSGVDITIKREDATPEQAALEEINKPCYNSAVSMAALIASTTAVKDDKTIAQALSSSTVTISAVGTSSAVKSVTDDPINWDLEIGQDILDVRNASVASEFSLELVSSGGMTVATGGELFRDTYKKSKEEVVAIKEAYEKLVSGGVINVDASIASCQAIITSAKALDYKELAKAVTANVMVVSDTVAKLDSIRKDIVSIATGSNITSGSTLEAVWNVVSKGSAEMYFEAGVTTQTATNISAVATSWTAITSGNAVAVSGTDYQYADKVINQYMADYNKEINEKIASLLNENGKDLADNVSLASLSAIQNITQNETTGALTKTAGGAIDKAFSKDNLITPSSITVTVQAISTGAFETATKFFEIKSMEDIQYKALVVTDGANTTTASALSDSATKLDINNYLNYVADNVSSAGASTVSDMALHSANIKELWNKQVYGKVVSMVSVTGSATAITSESETSANIATSDVIDFSDTFNITSLSAVTITKGATNDELIVKIPTGTLVTANSLDLADLSMFSDTATDSAIYNKTYDDTKELLEIIVENYNTQYNLMEELGKIVTGSAVTDTAMKLGNYDGTDTALIDNVTASAINGFIRNVENVSKTAFTSINDYFAKAVTGVKTLVDGKVDSEANDLVTDRKLSFTKLINVARRLYNKLYENNLTYYSVNLDNEKEAKKSINQATKILLGDIEEKIDTVQDNIDDIKKNWAINDVIRNDINKADSSVQEILGTSFTATDVAILAEIVSENSIKDQYNAFVVSQKALAETVSKFKLDYDNAIVTSAQALFGGEENVPKDEAGVTSGSVVGNGETLSGLAQRVKEIADKESTMFIEERKNCLASIISKAKLSLALQVEEVIVNNMKFIDSDLDTAEKIDAIEKMENASESSIETIISGATDDKAKDDLGLAIANLTTLKDNEIIDNLTYERYFNIIMFAIKK